MAGRRWRAAPAAAPEATLGSPLGLPRMPLELEPPAVAAAAAADSACRPAPPEALARATLLQGADASAGGAAATEAAAAGAEPWRTTGYALAHLVAGVLLHPVLRLLYSEGEEYGRAKNTVSVLDCLLAAATLAALRMLRSKATVWRRTAKLTVLPGFCIFCSISLATLANYESFWTFSLLAPLEILFVVLLARAWQKVVPTWQQRTAVGLVLAGAVLLTGGTALRRAGAAARPPDGRIVAILAAVMFRFNQALATIVIRNACVALREQQATDTLDISLCKIFWAFLFCVPYALVTEGVGAWSVLCSARGVALLDLCATVALTCVFQASGVGLNSHLRSVPATIVTQLQPVVQLCVAALLSGTPLSSRLHLKLSICSDGVAAMVLMLTGAICYLFASCRGFRRDPHGVSV